MGGSGGLTVIKRLVSVQLVLDLPTCTELGNTCSDRTLYIKDTATLIRVSLQLSSRELKPLYVLRLEHFLLFLLPLHPATTFICKIIYQLEPNHIIISKLWYLIITLTWAIARYLLPCYVMLDVFQPANLHTYLPDSKTS